MTPEDCIAVGGTFPGMELLNQINDLVSPIESCQI